MPPLASTYPATLQGALLEVRRLLPFAGPIKDFIHRNMLPGLQNEPFFPALFKAQQAFGAQPLMTLAFYRQQLQSGRIDAALLRSTLHETLHQAQLPVGEPSAESPAWLGTTHEDFCWQALLHWQEIANPDIYLHSAAQQGISRAEAQALLDWVASQQLAPAELPPTAELRTTLLATLPFALERDSSAIAFRLTAAFLDQGIALWPAPLRPKATLFPALVDLACQADVPLFVGMDRALTQQLKGLSPAAAVDKLLNLLVADAKLRPGYLQQALLARRGWAAMAAYLEKVPQGLADPRPISLWDFAAVLLWIECSLIKRIAPRYLPLSYPQSSPRSGGANAGAASVAHFLTKLGPQALAALPTLHSAHLQALRTTLAWCTPQSLGMILHIAYEDTFYQATVGKMCAQITQGKIQRNEAPPAKTVQIFFCIDDRECSLRRHLENVMPEAETFGTAGFFGIDFFYSAAFDPVPLQYCPFPLTPKHIVYERPAPGYEDKYAQLMRVIKQRAQSRAARRLGPQALWRATLESTVGAARAAYHLALAVLAPQRHAASHEDETRGVQTQMTLLHAQSPAAAATPDGLQQGYSYDEMAERVASVLKSAGLTENFAQLIVMLGHSSRSNNNPHLAAYGCGACSGRSGAPNARAFAHIANMPEVRARLVQRGIVLPDSTVFLGACHDTCSDEVQYFDAATLPSHVVPLERKLAAKMQQALGRNAAERCLAFTNLNAPLPPEAALLEVRKRSHALFEPRPELGHSGNALTFVGRRSFVQGLSFERRAFLQSYNPALDRGASEQEPAGSILAGILTAIVPVCGGISLDYYFSRVDNEVYGAGSKLPHNVCALVGVINGINGDLLLGLPRQAIELHEPLRMLFVIQQQPEIIDKAIELASGVKPWVENGWVHLVSIDPQSVTPLRYVPNLGWRGSL